jgi:hypothetical protein
MKDITISSRLCGSASASSACLSETLTATAAAMVSASSPASSISASSSARALAQLLVELGVFRELLDDLAHHRHDLAAGCASAPRAARPRP